MTDHTESRFGSNVIQNGSPWAKAYQGDGSGSFNLARHEWLDTSLRDGSRITLDKGATYFTACDIERYLEDHEVASQ
jgi:hypothetical protein